MAASNRPADPYYSPMRPEELPASWPRRFACAIALGAGLLASSTRRWDDPRAASRSWHFDVLLDGKSIGRHDFTVEDGANSIDVIGHARFDVRFAGFVVYQYEHWDHEGWSDGCLSRIDARTNDAGRTSRVQGELSGATFAPRSDGASSALPRCVHAYAYWNLQLLRQQHLLNPQTGTFDPVHLEELGVEAVRLSGRAERGMHYALERPSFRIELWYSPTGDWLALQTRTRQGRLMRYGKLS